MIGWAEMMQITSYTVSDVSGKIILSGELFQNSFGQSGIEMSALPKGFYFVKFSGARINRVVKVVKE
jgi:hypothetical protein